MAVQMERPQFYENHLQPIEVTEEGLLEVLAKLRAAIKKGVELIETQHPPPDPSEKDAFKTIYNGNLGIALMYLRLNRQSAYISEKEDEPVNYRERATARINPNKLTLDVLPGRPSPVESAALGAAVLRIMDNPSTPHKEDISLIREILPIAIEQSHAVPFRGHTMGGDEVLYGRTGVLWAVMNLQHHIVDDTIRQEFSDALPKLIDAIMDAGRVGRKEYIAEHGETDALPLMWLWYNGRYGLGR